MRFRDEVHDEALYKSTFFTFYSHHTSTSVSLSPTNTHSYTPPTPARQVVSYRVGSALIVMHQLSVMTYRYLVFNRTHAEHL